MLTEQEFHGLNADLESDRVERTESVKDTAKHCEAVCAFSNDFPGHRKPGYLFIGVDDCGNLTGLEVTDELLRNLGSYRDQGNILPIPAVKVYKLTFSAGDVAVVEVLPSDAPPVRYKGRTCIRVGPRRALASEAEERILSERRSAADLTFDARPCRGSSMGDLAMDLFLATYRQRRWLQRSSKRTAATCGNNWLRCDSTTCAATAQRTPACFSSAKTLSPGCREPTSSLSGSKARASPIVCWTIDDSRGTS